MALGAFGGGGGGGGGGGAGALMNDFNLGGGFGGNLVPGMLTVPVYTRSGDVIGKFNISQELTAAQLLGMVCERVGVDPRMFSIWAVSPVRNLLSLELDPDQYPADVMYHEEWTRYLKLFCEKKKRKKNHVWYECRLTLMTRCILPLEAMRECEDPRAVDLWFHESVYSVLKDKHFTVENDVALDLAAYQMQAVHSDHQKKLHGKKHIAENIRTYFSKDIVKQDLQGKLPSLLAKKHKKLKGKSKLEAQLGYLETLWDRPTFNAWFVDVVIVEDSSMLLQPESNAVLAFTDTQVMLLAGRGMTPYVECAYEDILDWDHAPDEVILTYCDQLGHEHFFNLYSKKGLLIDRLIERGTRQSVASVALDSVPNAGGGPPAYEPATGDQFIM